MTWVRIDDAAPQHPKLLRAGPESAWLWVAGLAYANRVTSDGLVPIDVLPALYPSGDWSRRGLARLAEKLVSVGLWVREGEAYRIHGYAEYQAEAMRSQVEQRRRWERERKASQRSRVPGGVPGGTGVGHGASVPQVSQVVSQTPVSRARLPGPARPVPTNPSPQPLPPGGGALCSGPGPGGEGAAPPRPKPRVPTDEELKASLPWAAQMREIGVRRGR